MNILKQLVAKNTLPKLLQQNFMNVSENTDVSNSWLFKMF